MTDRLPWAGPRLPPEASQQPRLVEMPLDGVGEPIQGRIEVDRDGAAEIDPIEAVGVRVHAGERGADTSRAGEGCVGHLLFGIPATRGASPTTTGAACTDPACLDVGPADYQGSPEAPAEPWNPASPKVNTPPSAPTSQ
jgi:hypothetical protein